MEYTVRKEAKRNNITYEGNPYVKMIEQKLNDELNNYCVECGNENPEYISINNGVFICVECVQNHLRFPKNISKIIKNNKNSLTLSEIQCLLCGGNKALLDFINNEFPKLSEFPPNILYRTQAMIYYRQNLQYLINGGIPPIKPSIKYAYKISNFLNNINQNYNNIVTFENEIFNTITDDRGFMNKLKYMNNLENNSKFFNSGYNFGRTKNINFESKISNTICNGENNFDSYIINKPRQVNFQNNNNFIIRNVNNNNNNDIYSPRKIKVDFVKKRQNSRNQTNIIIDNASNFNDIYVKPKPILSPKNNNLTKRPKNQRNCSADIIKKNYYMPLKYELHEKENILNINLNNSNNNTNKINDNLNLYNSNEVSTDSKANWKYRGMNKNFSQESYVKINKPMKYIKKSKYIHKSLSQRMIKNDSSTVASKHSIPFQTENSLTNRQINKYKDISPFLKTLTNKSNLIKNKLSSNDKEDMQILTQKRTITNTNMNFNKKKNEDLNFSQVESLPIKINLKLNKKPKENIDNNKKSKENIEENKKPKENIDDNKMTKENIIDNKMTKENIIDNKKPKEIVEENKKSKENIEENKKSLIKENNNPSIEKKNEVRKSAKNMKIKKDEKIIKQESKNKIEIKQKDNKREESNSDKKFNSKRKFGINKIRSQEDIMKEIKDSNKKTIINRNNINYNWDNKISIRNKYKQKTKHK